MVLLVLPVGIPAADDKKDDSVEGMPKHMGMFKGPLAEFMEIKSTRHIPGKEIIWSGSVYTPVKKFKGMKAKLSEGQEDDDPLGEAKLEFTPLKDEYQKGDKLTVRLRFPDAKTFKACRKIVLTRIVENKK
jgi:hypothetical protein